MAATSLGSVQPRLSGEQSIKELLHAGVSHHQGGRFTEADLLYKEVLKANPDNHLALQLSGVVAAQTGHMLISLDLLSKAISLKPDYVDALSNRGNVLQKLGRFDEALRDYDQAVLLKPDYVDALYNRGIALKGLKRFDEAIADYSKAISLKPDYAEAFNNRGNVLQGLGRFDEAMADYNKAISLKPDHVQALNSRGFALQELRRFDEAMADYNKAISLKPDYFEALNNRGVTLRGLQRLDEALRDFEKAMSLRPDHVEVFINRSVVLRELGRFDEAMAEYNKALSLKPDHVQALNSRGFALQELRRFDEAMADYNKAISLKPDYAEAHWNKSLQLLKQGEFPLGWKLYEWRWKKTSAPLLVRKFTQPLWLGKENLCNKTILLHCEQGLGDTIQFSRYAAEVSKLGCRTILEVQEPLFELMKGIEGADELIVNGADLPSFDFYCPLMSLPLAMGTTLETIPSGKPYLRSNDDKLAKWSSRLGQKSKPRVGIVWSGNTKHTNDHNRSIALEKILSAVPEDYELVSLQKEVRDADRNTLEQTEELRHFGAELGDFTDTAALCELMDIIVSVDTSVAHLAGALGKPVNLLLPYNSDFRWLLDRHDSPWYPSMKLFIQGPDMLWEPVFEKVNIDLDRCA